MRGNVSKTRQHARVKCCPAVWLFARRGQRWTQGEATVLDNLLSRPSLHYLLQSRCRYHHLQRAGPYLRSGDPLIWYPASVVDLVFFFSSSGEFLAGLAGWLAGWRVVVGEGGGGRRAAATTADCRNRAGQPLIQQHPHSFVPLITTRAPHDEPTPLDQ